MIYGVATGLVDRLIGLGELSCRREDIPPSFEMDIRRVDRLTFVLRTGQLLPVPPEEAFGFFQDPRNLARITPPWLDFRMLDESKSEVFEGAEFDYTIRWLGRVLRWRGRIEDYNPPHWFRDIQAEGPYDLWEHLHVFARLPTGTLVKDEVTYRPPRGRLGRLVHRLAVRRQLEDIFCFRAAALAGWAAGWTPP
ncbi:MAG: hypothetical protein Kow0025_06160 [Thermodesulfovibrionales bacterium]